MRNHGGPNMKTISRALTLILLATPPLMAQVDTLTSCQGVVSQDSVYTTNINPTLPKYRFHAVVRDGPCFTLVITHEGQPDTIQRIEQTLGSEFNGDDEFTKFLLFVDLNYDGYKDLQLFNEQSDPFNTTFRFWIFNRHNGRFELDAKLSEEVGCNPTIHKDVRTITHRSIGRPPDSYTWQKHRFIRGKYVLTEEENQSVARDSPNAKGQPLFIRTLRQLKGGTLKVVKEVKGTLEQIHGKWYKDPKYWEAEEAERDARGG